MINNTQQPGITILDEQQEADQAFWNVNVVLHNDDVNSLAHVVQCITLILQKKLEDAVELAMEAHTNGKVIVATVNREVAELYEAQFTQAGLTVSLE